MQHASTDQLTTLILSTIQSSYTPTLAFTDWLLFFYYDFFQAKILPSAANDLCLCATCANAYDLYVPIEHVNNINVLELIVVLLSLIRWKDKMGNSRVLAYCDN